MIWLALYVAAVVVLLAGAYRRAPTGWQDEAGFHAGQEGARDCQAERLGRELQGAGVHVTYVSEQEAQVRGE